MFYAFLVNLFLIFSYLYFLLGHPVGVLDEFRGMVVIYKYLIR